MSDWVIVVDDDTLNLKMAGHILSKNNMRVTALKSGQALLEYLKDNESPDLILLDIKMPGMDGFETLKKLREQENGHEEIPVIFLTADEDEEYEIIQNHPVMGARILKNIKEMPSLAIGARWHHERYGGGGYPDGLFGNDIPEQAQIIAVADAYDAMSSRRSYRDALPQKVVREEIEKGKGTQFAPQFADIMLAMIDEDTEYKMKE